MMIFHLKMAIYFAIQGMHCSWVGCIGVGVEKADIICV